MKGGPYEKSRLDFPRNCIDSWNPGNARRRSGIAPGKQTKGGPTEENRLGIVLVWSPQHCPLGNQHIGQEALIERRRNKDGAALQIIVTQPLPHSS